MEPEESTNHASHINRPNMPYSDTRYRVTHLLRQLGVAALYALLAKMVLTFFSGNGVVSIIWPSSGLALAVLLIGGKRYFWSVFLGAFLANAMAGIALMAAVAIAAGNTLEALIGAWLLTRNGRFDTALQSLRSYLLLVLAGSIGSVCSALNGATALLVSGFLTSEAYLTNLIRWWMGDVLGIVLITPMILVCWQTRKNQFEAKWLAEATLLLGLVFLVGQVIFLGWFHDEIGKVARGAWMFLLITWVALRLGSRGTVIAVLMMAAQALWGAHHGIGYFANDIARTQLVNYWLYMFVLSVNGMVLATFLAERKKNDEALRRSETKFRTLYDSNSDAVHLLDETGFIDCNEATLAMCGCATKEEFCSKSPVDFSPPEQPCGTSSLVLANQHIATAMKKGSHRFDWVSKRLDNGRLFHIDMQLTAMALDGKPVFLVVARDITGRKQAENSLRESEELLRRAQRIAHIGHFKYNPISGIVEGSDELFRIFGLTREQFKFSDFVDSVHPDDRDLDVATIESAIRSKTGYEIEHRLLLRDGTLKWVRAIGQFIAALPEKQSLLVGTVQDITEHKQVEEDLRESKARLRAYLDNISDTIWLVDANLDITYVSSSVTRLMGELPEELAGQPSALFIHPDDMDAIYSGMSHVLEHPGEPRTVQYRVKHKDGRWISVESTGVNMLGNPAINGVLVTMRDISERKLAEAAVRASETRLQEIINTMPVALFIKDPASNIMLMNRACEEQWGMSFSDLYGTDGSQFFPPEQMALFLAKDREVFANRKLVDFEETAWSASRRESRIMHTFKKPVFDAAGNPLYMIGISTDITERKYIEDELKRTTERYDFATAIGKVGTWDWSPVTGELMWSDETFRLLGLAPGSVTPTYELFLNMLHPEGREPLNSAVQAALYDRKPYSLDCRVILDNGKQVICHVAGKVEFDAANQPTRMLGTIQDITGRKQAEIALRESEERLRGIMDNASAVIFLKDTAGRYLLVNALYEKLFHISNEAIRGKTDHDIFPQDMADAFIEGDRKVIQSGLSLEIEERVPQDDGIHTYILVKFPLHSASGEIYAVCGIATDITGRKAAEQQLHDLAAHILDVREDEKSRIAREVHDELGGTLTALNIDAYWLSRKLSSCENAAVLVERLKSMTQRIDGAVNATRRIIDDMRPSVLDDLGLLAAIEWLAEDFQMRTGIECRVRCIEDEANLDKQRVTALFRILQETLTNVLKHSGASRVEIEFFHSENQVKLAVSDNGCGISGNRMTAPKLPGHKSYGMIGMTERAGQFGGRIIFSSPPEGGFCMEAILPLPAGERSAQ